jgi:hypothetical protein
MSTVGERYKIRRKFFLLRMVKIVEINGDP